MTKIILVLLAGAFFLGFVVSLAFVDIRWASGQLPLLSSSLKTTGFCSVLGLVAVLAAITVWP